MIGIWFSGQLLEFASKDVDLNMPKVKFKYIRFIAVGGAVLGSILVVPFRIPPISQAITPFVILVFSIPWVWSAAAITNHTNSIPMILLQLYTGFFVKPVK